MDRWLARRAAARLRPAGSPDAALSLGVSRCVTLQADSGANGWDTHAQNDVGRSVGGWDSNWYGRTIDPTTCELAADGAVLSAESLGGTLLVLADLDPASFVSGVSPLSGVVA